MVCYFCILNFPQFVVIHTVKGFSVVSEAEVDVFLEFCSFLCDPKDVSKRERRKGEYKTEGEKNNKVNDLNPCTSVISLNVSGFSIPIKR